MTGTAEIASTVKTTAERIPINNLRGSLAIILSPILNKLIIASFLEFVLLKCLCLAKGDQRENKFICIKSAFSEFHYSLPHLRSYNLTTHEGCFLLQDF